VGNGSPAAYEGRWVIQEYNGTQWQDKYTSSQNESNVIYSIVGTTAVLVRAKLY